MEQPKSRSEIFDENLHAFLQRWTLSDIRAMTLEQYTKVHDNDTFTYWLEHRASELGGIRGRPSVKFGIWSRNSEETAQAGIFMEEGEYKWFKRFGDSPLQAFEAIRGKVVETVERSMAGEFHLIDAIDLDSLVKWKIAFIFSGKRLLPIYKKDWIRNLARYFRHPDFYHAPISRLSGYIVEQKPPGEDFFDFYWRHIPIAKISEDRAFYVMGSKYGDSNGNDTVDVFPDMLEKGVVCTGFFWGKDFSHLVGKRQGEISAYLREHIPDDGDSKYVSSVNTFKYFLGLKKGDLIAIKSHGRYNSLTIIAYAVVKELEGKIYATDDDLGHIIHVDFLESGLSHFTGLNYSQTIHKIVPGAKKGHFEKIFGVYALASGEERFSDEEVFIEPGEIDSTEEEDGNPIYDIRKKDTSSFVRTFTVTQLVEQTHNAIQNEFAMYLAARFPGETIRTERGRIDIYRRNKEDLFIYEVKPYYTAFACIRAALGQLTDYAFSKASKLRTHMVVVGPNRPGAKDMRYINFLSENLGLRFSYEHFCMDTKQSVSYPPADT